MTYYMTSKRNSEIGYWVKCKATTLTGAKREATKRYGDGYINAVLVIAKGGTATEPPYEIASKSNAAGAKWINYN